MKDASRSLGFKLISISVSITAVAALIVGVLVTKMSEDATKDRLFGSADKMAAAVREAGTAGTQDLAGVILAAKLNDAGTAWVMSKDGTLLANPEAGLQGGGTTNFGSRKIRLLAVRQSLTGGTGKGEGSEVSLRDLVGKYEAGYGRMEVGEQTRVAAFRSLPEQGWLVGVDEPYNEANNVTASVKRYVLLTCAILGLCIILSTIVSISFIIKPYYREQVELTRKIEAANRNLKKLHALSIGMQKHLELDQRMRDILSSAREVVGMDRIFIFLPTSDTGFLQCLGAVGNRDEDPKDIRIPIGVAGGTISRAYTNKEVFRFVAGQPGAEAMSLAAPYSEIKALQSREYVVLPLIVENECVGVVLADNQLSKMPITKEKIEGMELFLNQAAVAIQNANMYAKLKNYADKLEITDHLTGVYTFDHFKVLLSGELRRARENRAPVTLGVISVLNFADYNRLSGHKNGDEVLARIAQVVKNAAGIDGVVGRCFGSTFGVIFSDEKAATAAAVLQQISSALAQNAFPNENLLETQKLAFNSTSLAYDPNTVGSLDEYLSRAIEQSRKSVA
jgi:diguanylate cyclase (GGDEF)-like protein